MVLRRVKILGAGSVGNHLAHAARTLGCEVVVCDTDRHALDRMRTAIYPGRYGAWDPAIELAEASAEPTGGFDLICIGTPPDIHLFLGATALTEVPAGLLVEKPLCAPDLAGLERFEQARRLASTRVFVGYDHAVGRAARMVESLLRDGAIGSLVTLDVEFREHWAGIFAAHPWLAGPRDSYVGFWRRGGGASGEHSHAVHLWQHFAHAASMGRVVDVSAAIRYVRAEGADYDDVCAMSLSTECGLIGRVVQDVVTRPARKKAVLQGDRGSIEWICGFDAVGDLVVLSRYGHPVEMLPIPKTRADDFIEELRFIDRCLSGAEDSPALDVERGIDTMLVLRAAHVSQLEGRRVSTPAGPSASIAETALA